MLAATNGENHLRTINELIYEYLADESLVPGKTAFSLENGEQYLQKNFKNVSLRRVSGELRITEVDVVVNYVLSAGDSARDDCRRKAGASARSVSSQKSNHAARSVVPTDAGLFIATK